MHTNSIVSFSHRNYLFMIGVLYVQKTHYSKVHIPIVFSKDNIKGEERSRAQISLGERREPEEKDQ